MVVELQFLSSLCLLATASGAGLEEIRSYIVHTVELNRQAGLMPSFPGHTRGLRLSCSLLVYR